MIILLLDDNYVLRINLTSIVTHLKKKLFRLKNSQGWEIIYVKKSIYLCKVLSNNYLTFIPLFIYKDSRESPKLIYLYMNQ